MATAADTLPLNSVILEKTRELCTLILDSPDYTENLKKVEAFEEDDAARKSYHEFMMLGQDLHQKQHAGTLTEADITGYEEMQKSLRTNSVVEGFMSAEESLNNIARQISQFVGKSLELGRLPEPEDLEASGCCSSGGCGCD